MITEDYKERLKKIVQNEYNSNEEILEAAVDYAIAKAVRIMSGRSYSDPMIKEYWNNYTPEIANAGMDVYLINKEQEDE